MLVEEAYLCSPWECAAQGMAHQQDAQCKSAIPPVPVPSTARPPRVRADDGVEPRACCTLFVVSACHLQFLTSEVRPVSGVAGVFRLHDCMGTSSYGIHQHTCYT